jgi:flagellar hook-associated protein 2
VNIASLPITQLNDTVTNLQSQSTALTGLGTKFSALQTAVQGIADAVGGTSFQTDISNPSVVSTTLGDGVQEGNYSIEVQDAGAYSTSLTANTWVDTPGPAQTYQLWVGDETNPANEMDITPADNSAQSVAAAINAQAGSKVRAVAVNVGTSDTPDWRISLQSTSLDDTPVDIQQNGASLQNQTLGRQAQYVVDNSGKVETSNSRSVQIASGLTVNLLSSSPGSPVNITVTRSTSALSSALSSFADAYNAVVDSLAAQRGTSAGALGGDSVIFDLTNSLNQIGTYSAAGSQVGGLADLGLDLGADGHLTFNSLQLMATDFSDSTGVTQFLGTSTSGGFLKTATDLLTGVQDPTTGILQNAETSVQDQITSTNDQIATKQDQVNALQTQLQQQMSDADAAIATMEQQYSYLNNMFAAMQTSAQEYK